MNGQCSFIDTRSISSEEVFDLFSTANQFRSSYESKGVFLHRGLAPQNKLAAFTFFESSTRTRMSFQTACYRLGIPVVSMDSLADTSIKKGESLLDTIFNVRAMNPEVLVVRCGQDLDLYELDKMLNIPIVNAGSGTVSHPTQALLDAYTIYREYGQVKDRRVLIVGDIEHSRVAYSNFQLLQKLGAKVAACGPPAFLPQEGVFPGVKFFHSLSEGLSWAEVCMVLRIQLERHDKSHLKLPSLATYHNEYGLTSEKLNILDKEGILMHPGPVNQGVELAPSTLRDKRSRILEQVENGVYVRAALMARVLGISTLEKSE